MSKYLSNEQRVMVINKPGGAATIGMGIVAAADPGVYTLALARHNGLSEDREAEIVAALYEVPGQVVAVLALDGHIADMSRTPRCAI